MPFRTKSHPGGSLEKSKLENNNINSWNVWSKHHAGKVNNVIYEMKQLDIDVLAFSETRWSRTGNL